MKITISDLKKLEAEYIATIEEFCNFVKTEVTEKKWDD